MIGLPSRVGDLLVSQLSHPRGALGRLVLQRLNHANRHLVQGCVQAIAPQTGQAVCDIGFGGGLGIHLLADRVGLTGIVTGVEPSKLSRTKAMKDFEDEIALDRVRIVSGVVSELPLDDASQSGVISVNTVYFWADVDVGLREIRRALAPGGAVAIGIVDLEGQLKLRLESRAVRALSADDVSQAMVRVGFERVSVASPQRPDGPAVVRGYRPA